MTEKDAELLYLRFFYKNVNLGEDADELKYFLNSQFKSLGNYVPREYDIYMKD